MRPRGHRLTALQLAAALGQTHRTVQRWLAFWFALRVRGVERVPAKGRTGTAYSIAPSVVSRWKRGALPVPHERALLRAA